MKLKIKSGHIRSSSAHSAVLSKKTEYSRLDKKTDPIKLKRLPLAVLACTVCLLSFAVLSFLLPKAEFTPSLPLSTLTDLNTLKVKLDQILQKKKITDPEVQKLLETAKFPGFTTSLFSPDSLELHTQIQFYKEKANHFALSFPVGGTSPKALLLLKGEINVPIQFLATLNGWGLITRIILSLGIAVLFVAARLWHKASSLIAQVDLLCQQFVRYRRSHESSEMELPDDLKQSDTEYRIAVLQDLWGRFQSTQNQLSDNVGELETSKRQLEQTIQDLKLAKEQEQRLIELGSAVAEFGHDIGNANGSIMTHSSLALSLLDKDSLTPMDIVSALPFIRRIGKSSLNIKGLTGEMLEFASGKTDLNKELYDLEEFEAELEEQLGFITDIEIEYVLPKNEVQVEFDVRKIQRVIVNLVKNAWEKLSDHENPQIKLLFSVHQNHLKIQVHDNGEPIPESIFPRLFQSFQTQGKEKGTGLGLAICKKIVEAHNGCIRAENLTKGEGGVLFEIILPQCVPQKMQQVQLPKIPKIEIPLLVSLPNINPQIVSMPTTRSTIKKL